MVRSLVMFFGLCLLVPASGCFFEEGGSGGSSGGGGTAIGACTNAEDTAVVCGAGFDETITTCATDAAGQGAETAECLVNKGLSTDCAGCYGAETQCIFDNCVSGDTGNCANAPTGADCMGCRDTNCTPASEECKGEVDCSGGTGGGDGNGGGGGNAGGGGNGGNGGAG